MKHFGWAPDFINTMTWTNLILYLASIHSPEIEDAGKEKIETKDASELF